jgi:hypothetical protein
LPWKAKDAKGWIEGATDNQATVGARVANEALARCQKEGGEDCEGAAIRQAKSVMVKLKESGAWGENLAVALVEAASQETVLDLETRPDFVESIKLAGDQSVQNWISRIDEAVKAKVNPLNTPGVWSYVCDVFESSVVYNVGERYFAAPYKVGADKSVVIGDPKEVERVMSYRDKSATSIESVVDALTQHSRVILTETGGSLIPREGG